MKVGKNCFCPTYRMAKGGLLRKSHYWSVERSNGSCTESMYETINEILSFQNYHDWSPTQPNYFQPGRPPFTIDEIRVVIMDLRLNKAPGDDGLPPEVIRAMLHLEPTWFTSIMNHCLTLDSFPDCWKIARVVLVPKPDPFRCSPVGVRFWTSF